MSRASENIKHTHILMMGEPEGEEKEEKISEEIMWGNFPNLMEAFNLHSQEAQQPHVGQI